MQPQVQAARELAMPDRFTVSQLHFLLGNIEAESEKLQRRIINRKLLTLLTRFTVREGSMIDQQADQSDATAELAQSYFCRLLAHGSTTGLQQTGSLPRLP